MENKKFSDIFKKYHPEAAIASMLARGENLRVRYMKDPMRVEAELDFREHCNEDLLLRAEEELRTLYSACSFRILPHYPKESFTPAHLKEIFAEGARVGAITKGFFDEAECEIAEGIITVRVPYEANGIQLIAGADTSAILSGILESRYGIRARFVITETEDARARTERRKQAMEENARRMTEEAIRMEAAWAKERAETEAAAEDNRERRASLAAATAADARMPATESTDEYAIGTHRYDLREPQPILGSRAETSHILSIASLNEPASHVTFAGEVFEYTTKDIRNGEKIAYTIGISDSTSSIYVKSTLLPDEGWPKDMKPKTSVLVTGRLVRDRFDGELVCMPKTVHKIKRKLREDTAEEKRVELHLHTNMSAMDGMITPADLVATAKRWGHSAIGVTDHGNVQAFPEIMKEVRKNAPDLKILYGMEGYYVDDTARALYGDRIPDFSEEMIVFDIETTGLSNTTCKFTEIGAVKIKEGEVIDRFQTFVDPEEPIPPKIVELTHITDDMVQGAPKIEEALRAFLDFAGERLLIAHNANFDVGFVRVACGRLGWKFQNPYLDTVALSRYLNRQLKKHTLDSIATHYGFGDFLHHRASEDAEMLAQIFFRMQKQLREEGIADFSAMMQAMQNTADPLMLKPYHIILYAKNKVGLKNLYRMISDSYLKYYRRRPRLPKSLIAEYREGVIVGSACESGELYQAILDGKDENALCEIIDFYDYLEIQPLCNNMFLVEEGRVADAEALQEINRRIIELGRKCGKLTVATCDAHFLNKEDEIYRKILLAGMKFPDADRDTGIYLRTTEEMLAEFSYLGEALAREVVIENPKKVAELCEVILPIPDGQYTPHMDGAEEELQEKCWSRAHNWYGEVLPPQVEERLEKELKSIITHGFAVLYMIAQRLVAYSESQGYLVGSRGSVGSSFVAIMAGISEVNPLPPHYRCPKCRHTEFDVPDDCGSGFDLPDKNCPKCGTLMYADGHDIPFETFLGFYGDKSPDIDLNFSGDVQGRVHKYTEELFGEGNVFRAGTIGTLAEKTAFGYVAKYLEERNIALPKAEMAHVISCCAGVKKSTGQHPGGIIVIPKEYDVYDFTPVQHPADDPTSDVITTHFQFSYLHDTILKLDELGHDMPTKYKMLERYTNTSVLDVKMNDRSVYELFLSTEPLGVTPEEIGCEVGTYGLPEMGTRFIQQVLLDARPKNFADLLQISGLTHGTNVWLGNAQDLIKAGVCDISQVVGTRDGIMLYLIKHKLDNSMSFKIMEDVRKGKGLKPEYEEAMLAHDVPQWYIDSCKKIKYMFPKAHAAAYVMSAIRLGWYKIYYPMEFYAAFLSVAPGGFDAEIVGGGKDSVQRFIVNFEEKKKDKKEPITQKDEEQYTTMLLVREAMMRGVEFLPIDLTRSHARYYLPENGKIRMPFLSLGGLGETAAEKIVEARDQGEFYSIEDFRIRSGISKSVVETLRACGALKGLSETNQFTFF